MTQTPKGLFRANQMVFYILLVAALFYLFMALGGSLTPFVIGALLAYFLDPLADRLQKRGFHRSWAAALLTFICATIFLTLAFIAIPPLLVQISEFWKQLPDLLAEGWRRLQQVMPPSLEREIQPIIPSFEEMKALLQNHLQNEEGFFKLLRTGVAFFDILMLILITPFVTFYLLRDWKGVLKKGNDLLPRKSADKIRQMLVAINKDVGHFIRGQGLVCLIQAVIHAIGLSLIGLRFGIWVGILTGLAAFIPVIGNLTMFLVALSLALLQFTSFWPIAALCFLYGATQVLETSILQPIIVGQRVNINPLWIILSLLTFGSLLGLAGALLAIPLAITAKGLLSYFIELYKDSTYYKKY